ncbi:hypothetical protein [Parabacteroides sp. PF5-9]|uniref:hypothetical protein n=1 Tax=Parabacteroides sp. PF5-9 TaxID=1742404 RepID=UPI0024737F65|nr:hypothetical protein [Parabacteroides sp. PF5-9]MDH6356664.1 hypothetical protein [Parabacteroides sp. PF5-9]
MKKEKNVLDQLKGKNPYKVPEGYMEGLTSQIMSQLPERPVVKEKRITMIDRVRPWLYMAAVFAGLVLFFRAIIGLPGSEEDALKGDSLLVRTEIPSNTLNALQQGVEYYDEDEEYLEYIEAQYANYLLAEELAFSE